MPAPAPYQRVIIDGIPYWKDAEGALYYYENSTHPAPDSRIQLGTQATGLRPDWQPLLSSKLADYRAAAKSRPRAAAAAGAPTPKPSSR
jgi:hypothetical protein